MTASDVLVVHGVQKFYRTGTRAVSDVSFTVRSGETLAIVGESGSGKTSLARSLMMLPPPTSGTVELLGVDLTTLSDTEVRRMRRRFQMVSQNPREFLDPRWTVRQLVEEPLVIHGIGDPASRKAAVDELLAAVGLEPSRFAHLRMAALSGGQSQRVAIARALAPAPDLVVFDEAVSALDVSVRAQILNLIKDLQREREFAAVFIGHDLTVVRHLCHAVVVMYFGHVVEQGRCEDVYERPAHPYTKALLAAVPGRRAAGLPVEILAGELPAHHHRPTGCPFAPRCPRASDLCRSEVPQPHIVPNGSTVACHHPST